MDIQTLFGYLTPISLTKGVIYHIMTLRARGVRVHPCARRIAPAKRKQS